MRAVDGVTPEQSAAIWEETTRFAAWNNLTQADAATIMHDLVVYFSHSHPPECPDRANER